MKKLFTLTNLWILVILVTLTGLFFPPLMGNDAPEYATIALRMHRDSDYVNIINRDYDYLDKPHILFWSASLGYSLFGVHDWSYRLLSVLICFLGAYATFRLGKLLYSRIVGHLAALMFISSQAIILANHDVRTDALLTGLIIICLWQLIEFIKRKKLSAMLIAAVALALAVGTKGMVAVLVIGCCTFFYVLSERQWKALWNWKWIAGLAIFILTLLPVLYCYYLQFDLHPEKLVNGAYGVSGVKFLLWTQSFERLAASHSRGEVNPEFWFLHHNFLWSFLPWTFLALGAFVDRMREFIQKGFRALFRREQLTFLGTFVMFTVMSLSKFKLPHYMNVLFPMIAIATAAFLVSQVKQRHFFWKRYFTISQDVTIVIIISAGLLLNIWVFPLNQWVHILTGGLFAIILLVSLFYVRKGKLVQKFWVPAFIAIMGFNFLMNVNFYPTLGQYQAGSSLAAHLQASGIDLQKVYTYDLYRSFDFYSGYISPQLSLDQVKQRVVEKEHFFLVISDAGRQALQQSGLSFNDRLKAPDFIVTRLTPAFLNPVTRNSTLKHAYIIEFNETPVVQRLGL